MAKKNIVSDYVKSSIITFITSFLLVALPMLGDKTWDKATLLAIGATALRAAIKAVVDVIQSNTKLLG